ncbi:hypothetical protein C5B90_19270 [Haloferax sp. Atlit-12N]|uniref:hypothetical protein n=1 Tax=Haloferax sp. Atlit-12N TaxID=2077203 RepID=UPI000E23C29F|nr:hypothetical protein [Haloferax sp. Atlit-12N]RDZ61413.1 hypothetical protein C5B90_19270 [Haloferax sp. Atlit-12N]
MAAANVEFTETTVTRYHEDLLDDGGRELRVQVAVDDVEVAVLETADEGVAKITAINQIDDTVLRRASFEAVAAAVDKLHNQGFETDLGPLGHLARTTHTHSLSDSWEDGLAEPTQHEFTFAFTAEGDETAPTLSSDEEWTLGNSLEPEPRDVDSNTKSVVTPASGEVGFGPVVDDEADQDEPAVDDADADEDEDDEVWCGICLEGPFQSLPIHHGRRHPDEEPAPMDHEPSPAFVARDPEAIVEDASTPRSLEEVLNAVERQDTIMDVHQRIAGNRYKSTQQLLNDLGLTNPGASDFHSDVDERLDALWRYL